jgi:hypothetical protein
LVGFELNASIAVVKNNMLLEQNKKTI